MGCEGIAFISCDLTGEAADDRGRNNIHFYARIYFNRFWFGRGVYSDV